MVGTRMATDRSTPFAVARWPLPKLCHVIHYLNMLHLPCEAAQRTVSLSAMVDQSSLAPDNFTTVPHFSVSSTMSLPKSLGEAVSARPPRSASCAFILGSATPAWISLLSLLMISTGVSLGAPTPNQPLAS